MKKFKKLYTLATLLMAGAAFNACTSDDFADEGLAPQQGKTYTLSVNATKGADTRALTESSDGKSLTATWNLNDEVAVYLDGEKVGTLMPDKAEADALLKGTVTGVKEGDNLDLVFSSDNYSSQKGTLEYIDANCNYAKATVTVTEIVGDAVNTSEATFVNQQSITKFTFSEEVSKVVIYNGVDEITVTPTAATETLYVAIPATDGEADFTFTATVDGKTYIGQHTLRKGSKLKKVDYFGSGTYLNRAVNKYGKKSFKIRPLEWTSDLTKLTELEYKYITEAKANGKAEYNISTCPYNAVATQSHTTSSFHQTEYQKKRASEANKNKIVSVETRIKQSEKARARALTPEGRQHLLIIASHTHTQESKNKISSSLKGQKRTEEQKKHYAEGNNKRREEFEEFLRIHNFKSINQIAEENNISLSTARLKFKPIGKFKNHFSYYL